MKRLFIIFFLLMFTFTGCKSFKRKNNIDSLIQTEQTDSTNIKTNIEQNQIIESIISGKLSQSSEFFEEEETITETFTVITLSDNESKKVPIKITTSKRVSYKVDNNFEGDLSHNEKIDTKIDSEETTQSSESSSSDIKTTKETEITAFNIIKAILSGILPSWDKIALLLIILISIIIWRNILKNRKKDT